MAMTIFLALNGLGVVFMLYVLANFWKEGRKSGNNSRTYEGECKQRDHSNGIVVTRPISHDDQGGLSVIPFQGRERYSDKPAHRAAS